MKACAIVGINWGDEGKGRMVDLLTEGYDVVIRYQGGGNAGHTVVNEYGKFALHLLPSGVFRPGVVNVLGNGVALDAENLWAEIEALRARGVAVSPANLKISDRASLLLPWHREQDALEEARLGAKQYGSTKQGIAPFYSDKYQKKTILAGELFYPDALRKRPPGSRPAGRGSSPTSATRALSCAPPPRRGRISCLKPSSALCATWTTASTPTRPPPTRSRLTRRSAPGCRR